METEVTVAPPRGGAPRRLIAILVVAFLLLAAAVGIYVAKPFTSPKQLLLSQLGKSQLPEDGVLAMTYGFELTELKGQPAELAWLEGGRLELGAELNLTARQLAVQVTGPYEAQTWDTGLFADEEQVILAIGGLLSVAEAILETELPLPAEYITISDVELGGALTEAWQAYDEARAEANDAVNEAYQNAVAFIIKGIPDPYFERVGLSGVRIRFDQEGLHEITKGIVTYAYEHQDEVVEVAQQLASAVEDSEYAADLAQIEANVRADFENTPLEEALAEIDQAFAESPLVIGDTSISFSRDTGVDAYTTLFFDEPETGVAGTVKLDYKFGHSNEAKIAYPSLDESNSMSLEELLMGLGFFGFGF